jgi:predicted PurR-regulated permease PerM
MNDNEQSGLLRDIYLVILTIIMFVLMFTLIAPFGGALLIALLLVASFQPMFKYISKYSNRYVATALSTIVVLLMVVVPLVLIISALTNEVVAFTSRAPEMINNTLNNGGLKQINDYLGTINPNIEIDPAVLQNTLLSSISNVGNIISGLVLAVLSNIGIIFAQFIVFVFSLVLLFKDFDKLPKLVRQYVPLSNRLEDTLLEEFLTTGKGVLKGTFLVALIHAVVTTFIFALFGIQGLALFSFALFIASLIPGGSQFVWIPTVIVVGFTQGLPVAILMAVVCLVSMNLIDTVVRPNLTGGSSKVHPLLSLLSILGGLVVYGFAGLFYGPLIAVLFITLIKAYNKRFKPAAS